jgi:UDP-2,3-diacylglucosamine hydrolase
MTMPEGEALTIIAGGGPIPSYVASAAAKAGRPVFVVGIKGEADQAIAAFPHEFLDWGQLGRLDEILSSRGGRDLVLVGSIRTRPDFKGISLDFATMRSLKDILAIIIGGDNDVLSGAVRFFEKRGMRVVGAHEVATDLVVNAGPLGRARPGRAERRDADTALRAARAIGVIDAGQAAVAVNGRIVALEAAEGTDAMLERVGALKAARRIKWEGRAGVLGKCAKPQQDLRVDMPTIGTRTVEAAISLGLAGIAVEAGRVMIVDRAETIRRADAAGVFVVGEESKVGAPW